MGKDGRRGRHSTALIRRNKVGLVEGHTVVVLIWVNLETPKLLIGRLARGVGVRPLRRIRAPSEVLNSESPRFRVPHRSVKSLILMDNYQYTIRRMATLDVAYQTAHLSATYCSANVDWCKVEERNDGARVSLDIA